MNIPQCKFNVVLWMDSVKLLSFQGCTNVKAFWNKESNARKTHNFNSFNSSTHPSITFVSKSQANCCIVTGKFPPGCHSIWWSFPVGIRESYERRARKREKEIVRTCFNYIKLMLHTSTFLSEFQCTAVAMWGAYGVLLMKWVWVLRWN